jgi:hypothetical protein
MGNVRTLKILEKVLCGNKHCLECRKQDNNNQHQTMHCTIFDTSTELKLLEFDKKKNEYFRCKECLDAEKGQVIIETDHQF